MVQDLRREPALPSSNDRDLPTEKGKEGGSGSAILAQAVVRPQDHAANWMKDPPPEEVPKEYFDIKPMIERTKEVEVVLDKKQHQIEVIKKGTHMMVARWLPQGRHYEIYRNLAMPGGTSTTSTYHANFQEVFRVCREMGVSVSEIMHTMVADTTGLIKGWDFEKCPQRSLKCTFEPTDRVGDKPIFQCSTCDAFFEYNEDQTLSLMEASVEQVVVAELASEYPPFTAFIDQIRGIGKNPRPKVSEMLDSGGIDSWELLFKATHAELVKIKGVGPKRAELLMYWASVMENG